MSFLNPVNEPVLRFSSTDAGAPQINFASRVAGDVKAVLKACLVTGYGAKASAGWTIADETASDARFISPSVSMGDIVLMLNDSATIPAWRHEVRGTVIKSITDTKVASGVTANHASNAWQIIVTNRGFFYIETLYAPDISNTTARLYYFGSMKSAVTTDAHGSGLWATGWNINSAYPGSVMNSGDNNPHFFIDNKKTTRWSSASFNEANPVYGVSNTDIISGLFIRSGEAVVGQHIGMMIVKPATTLDIFGVVDTVIDNRPALYVPLSNNFGPYNSHLIAARYVIIFLDYWEC